MFEEVGPGDYYYLHTNGSLIQKLAIVVDAPGCGGPSAYFAGPFVKKWWFVPANDIISFRKMIKEAKELGCTEDM